MKKICTVLWLASMFLFFTGISETSAVLKQSPPVSTTKSGKRQMPDAAKQPLPNSAVELPCVSTMIQGTPPYSTTGFVLVSRNSLSVPIPAGTVIKVNYKIRYHVSTGLSPQFMHRTHTLTSDLMPGQTIELVRITDGTYIVLTNCKTWFNNNSQD